MLKLRIEIENSYDIVIDKNINLKQYISNIYKNKKLFIVIDEIVHDIYYDNLRGNLKEYDITTYILKSNEENKTLETYESIVSYFTNRNITRDSLIIAIGGGVVGDVTGFVASTILRGVKYISIPTTLLSAVDSSIGGKTALNLNNNKNIIGSFYQPSLVLIDTNFLSSLTKDEINNGLGEIIKYGFIHDNQIISLLKGKLDLEKIIFCCLNSKKYFVEKDLYDLNERMILNFGHTFGHVIELEENYKHGIAVIHGMIMIINYGISLGITNESVLSELFDILVHLEIDYKVFDYEKYFNKIKYDKKNNENNYNFIFIEDISKPIIKKIKR